MEDIKFFSEQRNSYIEVAISKCYKHIDFEIKRNGNIRPNYTINTFDSNGYKFTKSIDREEYDEYPCKIAMNSIAY